MRKEKQTGRFVIDKKARDEATDVLRRGVALRKLILLVRERFKAITNLLNEPDVRINKHDLSHQMRTALNSVAFLEQLGFSKRETLLVGVAGILHDIGYIHRDVNGADKEGYNAGIKGWFKRHALHGANELEAVANFMLKVVNDPKILEHENPEDRAMIEKKVSEWREMLQYKDEDGKIRMIGEDDIQLIKDAILHHNDYGKDKASYDPTGFSQAALATQLSDKLDIVSDRVDKKNLIPSQIHPKEGSDNHSFHRRAPWCITDYHFSVDPEAGTMHAIYEVDFSRLDPIMQAEYEGFQYTEEQFTEDFIKSYTKNCQVAAEAAGVLMNKANNQENLKVELHFKNSETTKLLSFSRPERDIYGQTNLQQESLPVLAS